MNETRHAFQIQADQTLGKTITLAAGEPAPPDYTFLAPPERDSDSVVLWTGNGWQVLTSESSRQAVQAQGLREQIVRLTATLVRALDTERDRRIAQGKPHTFADALTGTVQLRDARDTGNVNAVATSGTALVIAGDAQTRVVFRDAQDVTHELSGEQAVAFGLAVMAWVSAHYAAAWAHKDAIKALCDAGEDIAGYDLSQGWPQAQDEEATP
jgi:hypothetical protein